MGGVCLVGEHFLIAKPQMNSVGFKPIRKKQILAEVLFICLFIYLTSLNTAHKNNVKNGNGKFLLPWNSAFVLLRRTVMSKIVRIDL